MLCGSASAGGVVLGLGVETDTAGGRAASAFADLGVGEQTWLSAAAAAAQGGGTLELDTVFANLALEHSFDPAGFRIGAAYWGDKDILDSVDLQASLFTRGERAALSADYERRNFDFIFREATPRLPAGVTEFHADGLGLTGRFNTSTRSSLFFGGMGYKYSRDLALGPRVDLLRDSALSRLSLMNSLLDYRGHAGVEWRFNLTSIDLRFDTWRTAVDQEDVYSLGLGALTPIAERGDMEFRMSYDESANYGSAVSFAVYLYYFGGRP
jgi:hypothetical protein